MEQLYYSNDLYSLCFYQLDQIEKEFIDYLRDYIYRFPLIISNIINKILACENINSVIDNTFIISTYKLNRLEAHYLFNFLKELLRKTFIKKIIYKKEFIIVHLYSNFVTKILSIKNKWMLIEIYSKLNHKYKIYFDTLYEDKKQKKIIDLLIINKEKKIIISTNEFIDLNNYAIDSYFLYLSNTVTNNKIAKKSKIKYNYERDIFTKTIESIII